MKVCSWIGNSVADMLIEQKRVQAEKERIAFDIEIVPIEEWLFTCSLLGNLLDNAIDACKRIEQNDKWILLQIEIQKNFLFIKISNSIDEMPVMKKGIPVSTKQNKKRHGYGLKINIMVLLLSGLNKISLRLIFLSKRSIRLMGRSYMIWSRILISFTQVI